MIPFKSIYFPTLHLYSASGTAEGLCHPVNHVNVEIPPMTFPKTYNYPTTDEPS